MTQDEVKVVYHQSGGQSSRHDVLLFRAWKEGVSDFVWNRAMVDKHDGLTLFYERDDYVDTLRFPHAKCGWSGTGPQATVTILTEAGFGVDDPDQLEADVYTNDSCEFTRTL